MPSFRGSDGAALHYDQTEPDGGATLTIVTLAGGAARHPDYLGDLAGLGARHQLVVPHLRGVGRSGTPEQPERGSFWRQAEDVDCLRAHLGLERLLLLGHSAGTRLAVSYAAQFPARVAAMVLVTPPATYLVDEPPDAEQLIDRRRGQPAFDDAMSIRHAGADITDEGAFNAWQQRMAPAGYAVWGEAERAHASTAHFSLAASRAYFSVPPPPNLATRLGALDAPVLVVAGGEDCVTGRAPVAAMARIFPAGRIAVIDRCGHFPWVEQPTAFRQVVDRFLDELPRA
jgi:pimeloyl-ACP methyl ester carboxylesterase